MLSFKEFRELKEDLSTGEPLDEAKWGNVAKGAALAGLFAVGGALAPENDPSSVGSHVTASISATRQLANGPGRENINQVQDDIDQGKAKIKYSDKWIEKNLEGEFNGQKIDNVEIKVKSSTVGKAQVFEVSVEGVVEALGEGDAVLLAKTIMNRATSVLLEKTGNRLSREGDVAQSRQDSIDVVITSEIQEAAFDEEKLKKYRIKASFKLINKF